jgi:hypothetical protein
VKRKPKSVYVIGRPRGWGEDDAWDENWCFEGSTHVGGLMVHEHDDDLRLEPIGLLASNGQPIYRQVGQERGPLGFDTGGNAWRDDEEDAEED